MLAGVRLNFLSSSRFVTCIYFKLNMISLRVAKVFGCAWAHGVGTKEEVNTFYGKALVSAMKTPSSMIDTLPTVSAETVAWEALSDQPPPRY